MSYKINFGEETVEVLMGPVPPIGSDVRLGSQRYVVIDAVSRLSPVHERSNKVCNDLTIYVEPNP